MNFKVQLLKKKQAQVAANTADIKIIEDKTDKDHDILIRLDGYLEALTKE